MTKTTYLALAVAAVCGDLLAQSNALAAGYNGALSNISSARAWGRRGAAYPNGELGASFQNELCNPGTIPIEWRAPMQADHPMFSFMVVREVGGRLVQISDWSYCKHAFLSLNNPSTCGGSCVQPPNGGAQLGIKCSDVYSNSNNGSRTYLGPPAEIDPWLGVWNPVGSYFDIGDAQTGIFLPGDGIRSLITTGFDAVKNRVTIQEKDVQGGVSTGMYFQIQVLHRGERLENRANNIMSRPFTLSWSGTAWTAGTTGAATFGSILSRWPGSTVAIGSNGGTGTFSDADGQFAVAVKVSGPTNGMWHYEYAVHNMDNSHGASAFRLPVCAGARVENFGFRDIDSNMLNEWTGSLNGNEIAFVAPAGNPQNWNQLFNFWFDSDVAPVAGTATIDQASPVPLGALTVSVATQVPGLQPSVYLGAGCGTPAAEIFPNGIPSAGNAGFAINAQSGPSTPLLLFFSDLPASTPLGAGCTLYLDLAPFGTIGLYVTDVAGNLTVPIPVSPSQMAVDLYLQAATFVPSPPLFGLVGLSNGLKVRFAGLGCD